MSVRCFVGIELPDVTRKALADAGAALMAVDGTWRDQKWVAAENLHVTVHFVGSVAESLVPDLAEAIGTAVADLRGFELCGAHVSAVPGLRRCRMVWAAFDDPYGSCAELDSAVGAAASPFGEPPANRPFRAHVTLARARKPRPLLEQAVGAANDQLRAPSTSMSVRSATLFASRLTSAGPVYRRVKAWQLKGE